MNESKLKIFRVAFSLFLQKSFKEVTMNDILEKSGLSRGTFYYYFKSKEELYAEVIDAFFVVIPTSVESPLNVTSLYDFYHDYLDNASRTYAKLGEAITEADVDVFSYFSLSFDAMKRLPDFRDKMRLINDKIIQIWINIIRSAREKGEISSEMTDEQIACFFKFTMEGMGLKSTLENKPSAQNDKELIALWDNFYSQIRASGQ